jgi:hypothetical protein
MSVQLSYENATVGMTGRQRALTEGPAENPNAGRSRRREARLIFAD